MSVSLAAFDMKMCAAAHCSLQLAHVLDGAGVDAVLLDDLAVMEHVELLGGVLACEEHDGLLATRMVSQKVGAVVDLVADDAPAVLLGVVLGDLSSRDHFEEMDG